MKQLQGYNHGINLGGWLSQCDHTKERYDTFINKEDIRRISSWGLDHVRIPVDYNLVEDENGNYLEEGFAYIDSALEWCREFGLNMILDVHKTYGFSFDDEEHEEGFFENADYQERFYRLWETFATRYGKYSDRLAFELLNEVTDKEYCELWNDISEKCIRRIRAIAPDTKILIGGYYNNAIEALKDLRAPYDENIIYNFHCYEPLVFTHQGGYWVAGMDQGFRMPIDSTYGEYEQYTAENLTRYSAEFFGLDKDKTFGVEYFEKLIGEAVRVAEERNVPLYCGEFGVIDLAEPEDSLKWFEMICSVFDKYGIGRAAWSYKEMDFGFIDEHMKDVLDRLIKVV